ncbi:uncharacterized protein SCHCODRAFT_02079635 [Schizophyllum commune H4-8]|uniref:uncharacterized protein n=1 Tax=Schizophyllum commune (strain H4-8 / FGSC 9210) TaxID=578458 RepID=UPI00215DFBD5|nr:uncharacterized protein SCHCODRAFT_02079635 [Schizophyllum commune H4-8]KAI5888077.1 hypothetical protein SCHCODRAFT_02079635 [Schizophyllum commune H4-8]
MAAENKDSGSASDDDGRRCDQRHSVTLRGSLALFVRGAGPWACHTCPQTPRLGHCLSRALLTEAHSCSLCATQMSCNPSQLSPAPPGARTPGNCHRIFGVNAPCFVAKSVLLCYGRLASWSLQNDRTFTPNNRRLIDVCRTSFGTVSSAPLASLAHRLRRFRNAPMTCLNATLP